MVAVTTYLPTYTDPQQLAQAMHGLHMSEMIGYDDDGEVDEEVKDIDTTLMATNAPNTDFKLGRPPTLQAKSHTSPQYLALGTTSPSHIQRKKMGSLKGPIKRSTDTSETSWRIKSA